MASLSRRNFLQAGGAAAAGAAVLAGPLAGGAAAAGRAVDTGPAEAELVPDGTDHLVMVVRNPSEGEVSVLTHGHEVVFHDPQLVARVQRAMKKNAR